MAIRFNPLGIGFSVSSSAGGSPGANTILSNLTSPTAINQFLLPDGNNTQEIGSNSLQFANITSRKISSADAGGITRGVLDGGITTSSASSTAITGALQLPHASGAAFAVQTQASAGADAVATNPLYFETGSKTNILSTGSTGLIQFRTGTSEGGNSGSIDFYTGNVNAGSSGSMNFTTGTVSGGTRGAMTFTASGLTVNTSTINITGEFSNHLKSQFSSLTVGTTSAPFGTHYAASSFNLISSGVDRLIIDNTNSQTTPYGLTVNTSIHRPYQDSSNCGLGIFTDSDATATAVDTGLLSIGTGNKTAGTGNSGSFILSTGSSSGGSTGNISLESGNSVSSFSGDIFIKTGSASLTSGNINLETGSAGSGKGIVNLDTVANVTRESALANSSWGNSSIPAIVIDGTTTEALAAFGSGIFFKGTDAQANLLIYTEDLNSADASASMYIATGRNAGSGNTGTADFGTGDAKGAANSSGGTYIRSGNSDNGDSGPITLFSGLAPNGTQGNIVLSAPAVVLPVASANPTTTQEGAAYAYSNAGTYELRIYLNGGWRSVTLT